MHNITDRFTNQQTFFLQKMLSWICYHKREVDGLFGIRVKVGIWSPMGCFPARPMANTMIYTVLTRLLGKIMVMMMFDVSRIWSPGQIAAKFAITKYISMILSENEYMFFRSIFTLVRSCKQLFHGHFHYFSNTCFEHRWSSRITWHT